jgi:Ca2+-transporting ATPase
MAKSFYQLSSEESIKKVDSSEDKGLSSNQIEVNRERFGTNKLSRSKGVEIVKLLVEQLKSPFVWILFVSSIFIVVVETFPQNLMEASFIWGTILINTIFGFWQEFKASKVLESLQEYDQPQVLVLRDGQKRTILQQELVVGDIVLLRIGDKVPADGRIVKNNKLKVSEAVLTGESVAINKQVKKIKQEKPIFERQNMVFRGTVVEKGSAHVLVTAVGDDTEIGRIAGLVQSVQKEKSPLQEKMQKFVKMLAVIMVSLTFVVLVVGALQGRDLLIMFETSLAIVTGGIPEALPIIMALILAIGMKKLAQKKGIVRKLSSVETLGSTTIICSDKTKTLTTGEMEVVSFSECKTSSKGKNHNKERIGSTNNKSKTGGGSTIKQTFDLKQKPNSDKARRIMKLLGLVNGGEIEYISKQKDAESNVEKDLKFIGDPTDRAITKLVYKHGFYLDLDGVKNKNKKFQDYKLLEKQEFDSQKGYQSKIYDKNGELLQVFLGMPEKLISLDSNKSEELSRKNIELTKKGYRVICLATRYIDEELYAANNQLSTVDRLEVEGLIALVDPIRKGVKESLEKAQEAGAKVVIITGDHKNTAVSVAGKLGLEVNEKEVLLGEEVGEKDFADFVSQVHRYKVYARIKPENKMKIVKAWQKRGEVVAMTGDGVNDGPAIKQADIGIAVGSGTEVAKQSSDLVLLNDSFNIIVEAISQGRMILDNIRKATTYVLADSLASIVLVGMSILLKLPLPIMWQQILWNNLVEDTFPNIAFAFEPKEKNIMNREPESKDTPLLTKPMKKLILIVGVFDQILTFGLFVVLYKMGFPLDYIRTMVFGSLVMDTGFVIYSFKNLHKNIWEYKINNNKYLVLSSFFVFAGFAAALYVPFLSDIVGTVPLSLTDWGIQVVISLIAVGLTEIGKWLFIKEKII